MRIAATCAPACDAASAGIRQLPSPILWNSLALAITPALTELGHLSP
jgi:hypothetical protein|eukprot:COSAG06_NODE_1303_length_9931_cov_69.878255_12_plen_47_part_00